MEPSRQKWLARLALGIAVALGLAWLARLDFARKVSTNVLDLVPRSEQAPELALARSLADEQHARVAFFVLSGGGDRLAPAAEAFIAKLRGSPAFSEVIRIPDTAGRDALGKHVYEHRFDLLLPGWLASGEAAYEKSAKTEPLASWLAEKTAGDLERFMATPEAMAFQDLVPSDPLLLIPELVEHARGLEASDVAPGPNVLIWARTTAPPLSEAAQQPVFAVIEEALAAARAAGPAVQLHWTSIGRFAAENRQRIQDEMSWLNIASLVAVLGVAAVCLKHVLKSVHLVPVVLGALLGAWVVATAVFDRVHILVFVVGSLLGGVAIDYGFYLFLQPPAFAGEPYAGKVRRLLKPLLASALTTVLGFSLLLWSELPLIRQLGVFVSAGLVSALAAALLWFAQRDETYTSTRAFARARYTGESRAVRYGARLALALGAAVAVAGPWTLHWRDDIRELQALPPGFQEEALSVREQFGDSSQHATYLTRGDSPGAARAALAEFFAWNAREFPESSAASLGLAVPTPVEWDAMPARLAKLGDFEPALRAALARHGFDAEAFAAFFTSWHDWLAAPRPSYDATVRSFAAALRGPIALTMSIGMKSTWFVTVTTHPPGVEPPPGTGTVSLDQLQSFNRLFSRYRMSALQLSTLGLVLLGISVLGIYGVRRGAGIFAVPAGSCLFALGLLGLLGQTLNLFHLLGAFLGVCLSHNYAIFTAENETRGDEPPPSIRLSALTTGTSFGVLAFSRIPVVAALGITVALIVLTALAIVELAPFARRKSARCG